MQPVLPEENPKRSPGQDISFFAALFCVLAFANFDCFCSTQVSVSNILLTLDSHRGFIMSLGGTALGIILILWFGMRWWKVVSVAAATAVSAYLFPDHVRIPFVIALLGLSLITSTDKGECGKWFDASWSSAKQMLPLLLMGVMIAGLLLGSKVGEEGLLPADWIAWALSDTTIRANFFASVAGALMYFATLTEVPFVQGLISAGMGKGPALALLLAGPSLSLPSMLVISSVLGLKKTIVFVGLVVAFSMIFGMIFGYFYS
jgi:uncharacterized membrane protein YraQ (UPF0718 family)